MSEAAPNWTIKRTLLWASDDFRRRGIESPRLDAELLLAHALGWERIRLFVDSDQELSPEELGRYRELIKRRRTHEPIAYLIGQREFYGLDFRVDRRVLVPRPDTEILVEVALTRTQERDMFGRGLDLCTGSGCVAIAFARQRPTWQLTGVDLDAGALAVAQNNALRLGPFASLHFAQSDLFAALPSGAKFDLITANPPYIPASDIPTLPPDVQNFEPHLALDGGPDGLDLIRRIIADAPLRLVPNGVIALEINYDQAPQVNTILTESGFTEVQVKRDYGGRDRVVSGVWVGD